MVVMKFGGAALQDAEGFRRMVSILSDTDHALVVVSALAATTRELEQCAVEARSGDLEGARATVERIVHRHTALAEAIGTIPEQASLVQDQLQTSAAALLRILDGVAVTAQLTARTLDRIMSFGERMALDIAVHAMLVRGLDAVSVDAVDLIVTSDVFGKATPIASKSRIRVERLLSPLLSEHRFVVVQGFVGATEDGDPSTMGKESSNLTATFLGALAGATRVVVWTDVEGVRSTDPHIVPETQLRPTMSYAQAKHAAHHGLKLLYRTMIEPAEQAGIPITIASAEHPDGGTTEISEVDQRIDPIITVRSSTTNGLSVVSILFASTQGWLQALSESVVHIKDPEQIYVVANPQESAVTITVPHDDAVRLAQQLHTTLIHSSARIA